MWLRKWLSAAKRERYGHYTTLLKELRREDEKAFFQLYKAAKGSFWLSFFDE